MKSDDDLVAEFIAKQGVTKCPPALAAETTVDIAPETAAAHAARGIDPAGDAWRKSGRSCWPKALTRTPGGAK